MVVMFTDDEDDAIFQNISFSQLARMEARSRSSTTGGKIGTIPCLDLTQDSSTAVQTAMPLSETDPKMGRCPICYKCIEKDKLEAHVNDELNRMDAFEQESTSRSNARQNGLALDQSIIISDDDDDEEPPRIQTNTSATHTFNANDILDSDQLSPLEGFVSLHELRKKYPEVEAYFHQFSTTDDNNDDVADNSFLSRERPSSRATISAIGRSSRTDKQMHNPNTRQSTSYRRNTDDIPVNHYAGDPIEPDDVLLWEGPGTTSYGRFGMDEFD